MRLDIQVKGESVERSEIVERSASVNGKCRDEYE